MVSYNPQSNGIIKRMHGAIKQKMRCIGIDKWLLNFPAVAWFLRAEYQSAIDTTTGKMVYNFDMLLTYEKNIIKSKRNPGRGKDLERESKNRIGSIV